MPENNHPSNTGITFSFGIEKEHQQRERPHRIVVVGEFSGADRDHKPVKVDKYNFDDVIQAYGGQLLFEPPNRIGAGQSKLVVDIDVTQLNDFTPAGLIRQVPELRRAVRFRDSLNDLARNKLSFSDFEEELSVFSGFSAFAEPLRLVKGAFEDSTRKQTASAPPAPRAPRQENDSGDLSRLLDMVDTGAPSASPQMEALERSIREIGSANSHESTPQAMQRAIALTERVIEQQLDLLLHHPVIQKREAMWRGLKFLVDHVDSSADVEVELLDAPQGQATQAIEKWVVEPELHGRTQESLTLVVALYEIDNNPTDLDWLQALAAHAEALQVPLVTAASHRFFGLEEGGSLGDLPYLGNFLDTPEYDQWNSLRDKESARWLAVAVNPFLLRLGYQGKERKSAGFRETVQREDELLWGNPAWLLATLVAQSLAKYHWPTEITGLKNGSIGNLHVHETTTKNGRETQIPLRALLSEQLIEDLAEAGFMALACQPDRDDAYLFRAPCVHRPRFYQDPEVYQASRLMSKLPYQLLTASVVDAVLRHRNALPGGASPEETARSYEQMLRSLVARTGQGSGVTTGLEQGPQGGRLLTLNIATGRDILNGAEVNMAIPV